MSGVRREWMAGSNFVMIHLDLVDALGGSYEAAAVLNRIQFRGGDEGWVVTKDEMMADIRLSEWKLDRAIRELRNAGFITSERESRFDPTLRWCVVYADPGTVKEESSVTRTGDPSVTGSVKDETSFTVKDETSFSSTKNVRTSTDEVPSSDRPQALEPLTHDRASMTPTWTPRPLFWQNLGLRYSGVVLDYALTRFRAHKMDTNAYSRSWENSFEAWVAEDQRRRDAEADTGATDDMGRPLNQRTTSAYEDTRTVEEIQRDEEELISLARQSEQHSVTEHEEQP